MNVLSTYERGSGEQVNIDKSDMFFSSNTPLPVRDSIMSHLGVHLILGHSIDGW